MSQAARRRTGHVPQAPTKRTDGTRLRGPEKTLAKKQALSARALDDLDHWIAGGGRAAAAE